MTCIPMLLWIESLHIYTFPEYKINTLSKAIKIAANLFNFFIAIIRRIAVIKTAIVKTLRLPDRNETVKISPIQKLAKYKSIPFNLLLIIRLTK